MSKRVRSVDWIEGRILGILSKIKQGKELSLLALSAMAMRFEVRNHEEQNNFDYALFNLVHSGSVIQIKDENGFTSYKLAA